MGNRISFREDNQEEAIRKLLVGRSIISVNKEKGELTLDNGYKITIVGNDGGCSCGAGDYFLTDLYDNPINMIMNVEFMSINDGQEEGDQTYLIFVYAENKAIKLAEISGSDGNGYYGTGYSVEIKFPEYPQ